MDLIGHGFEHVLQELPGCASVASSGGIGERGRAAIGLGE
jgi:hypothetical protein